jgi:hypothetical protein
MYSPGHLHRASLPGQPEFAVDLYYEVRQDPQEGPMLHFHLSGQIAGKALDESFELHRDTAYNFASVIARIAEKHGLPVEHSLVMHDRGEYELMYGDIREKLGTHPGEPMNLDHLGKDHL